MPARRALTARLAPSDTRRYTAHSACRLYNDAFRQRECRLRLSIVPTLDEDQKRYATNAAEILMNHQFKGRRKDDRFFHLLLIGSVLFINEIMLLIPTLSEGEIIPYNFLCNIEFEFLLKHINNLTIYTNYVRRSYGILKDHSIDFTSIEQTLDSFNGSIQSNDLTLDKTFTQFQIEFCQ